MIRVGELQVALEAQTRQFNRAFRQMDRRLSEFERDAKASTDRIRFSFGGIAAAVVGVVAAIAAVRGFAGLIRGSIEAAASFEQFEVQLTNFVGSTDEARRAVDNFTESASRTPFAVRELVRAGTILGGVAIGNRKRLEELVDVSTNLAAVTGLSLEEASSNLQRSLSAGIASADLFRERGVRQLIEAVAEIPDATKLSTEELEQVFKQVFGPGGVFGDAASQLSFTLGGALSNVDDAVTNLQASLGAAFAPAVVAGLREFLIPFLERLRELVENNRGAILDFAFNAVRGLINGFVVLTRAGSFAVDLFIQLIERIRTFREQAITLQSALTLLNVALGRISREDATTQLAEQGRQLIELREESRAGTVALEQLRDGLVLVAAQAEGLGERFDRIDIRQFIADVEAGRTASEGLNDALARAGGRDVSADQTKLLAIERQLEQQRLKQVDPLLAQAAQIDVQIEKLRALDLSEADRARSNELIAELQERQAGLLERSVRATRAAPDLERQVTEQLAALSRVDPQAAEDLGERLSDAINDKVGEGLVDALRDISADAEGALEESLGPRVGEVFSRGLGSGFDDFLAGGTFLDSFAASIQGATEQSLSKAFQKSIDLLGTSLSETFDGLDGRLGEIFGNRDLLQGALGIGAAIFQGLRNQASVSTSTGAARSAVSSTQQVRGIVAGPTQIAVAEVSRGLGDALRQTERLLALIADNTRRTADGVGAAPAGGGTSSLAGASLALESESLA